MKISTLAAILLLSFAPAQGAPPAKKPANKPASRGASKPANPRDTARREKVLDELLSLFYPETQLKGDITQQASKQSRQIMANDPRFDSEDRKMVMAVKLSATVDVEAIVRHYKSIWMESLTEREISQLIANLRSDVQKKAKSINTAADHAMIFAVHETLVSQFPKVTNVPFQDFPSPLPIKSPSPVVPSPAVSSPAPWASAPVPSPSPAPAKRPEASWLTRVIWKWFPETNCGCAS